VARYDVQHACGHTVEHQLTGPGRTRDWRLKRLAEETCWDCDRAERAAALDLVNHQAAEAAAAAGLPTLEGSERQVAWATTLRADALAELDIWGAEASTKSARPRRDAQLMDLYRQVLLRQTAAREWIDTRYVEGSSLLRGSRTAEDWQRAGGTLRRRLRAWLSDDDRTRFDELITRTD
jgi:hypothetical protein